MQILQNIGARVVQWVQCGCYALQLAIGNWIPFIIFYIEKPPIRQNLAAVILF